MDTCSHKAEKMTEKEKDVVADCYYIQEYANLIGNRIKSGDKYALKGFAQQMKLLAEKVNASLENE